MSFFPIRFFQLQICAIERHDRNDMYHKIDDDDNRERRLYVKSDGFRQGDGEECRVQANVV